MHDPDHREHKKELDYWYTRGINKTCSFCGSMHPDEFFDLCKKVIENKGLNGYEVSMSDKKYKIYVRQPGVSNAGDGVIKFYVQHIRPKDKTKEFENIVNEAIRISSDVFNKKMEERRKTK